MSFVLYMIETIDLQKSCTVWPSRTWPYACRKLEDGDLGDPSRVFTAKSSSRLGCHFSQERDAYEC